MRPNELQIQCRMLNSFWTTTRLAYQGHPQSPTPYLKRLLAAIFSFPTCLSSLAPMPESLSPIPCHDRVRLCAVRQNTCCDDPCHDHSFWTSPRTPFRH